MAVASLNNTKETKAFCWFPTILVISLFLVRFTNTERLDLYTQGDLAVGGMFPIHSNCDSKTPSKQCHPGLYPKGLFLAEAMAYAVQLVNKQGIIPFNISLGYHVRDTCNSLSIAVENALLFSNQRKRSSREGINGYGRLDVDQYKASSPASLIGVIGAGTSELSLAVNNILSLYGIAQVAYASSAAFLSDKSRYKTFLRVLPPDSLQANAIAQLMAHFKWNYISLVSSDDHYAGPLREAFRAAAQRFEICLSNDIVFSYRLPSTEVIQRGLQSIKQTDKSRVILLLASEITTRAIMRVADSLNLTDRIWIASDAWSNAEKLLQRRLSVLRGGLGVLFSYRPVKGFVEHLQHQLNTTEGSLNNDPWLRGLSCAVHAEGLDIGLNSKTERQETGFDSVFARVDYVMNSVFILGHVIKEFCLEIDFNPNATMEARKAKCLENIYPKALLRFIFNRTVRGFSRNFTIDKNGDPSGSYDFLNMQENAGKLNYIKIGSYDSETQTLQVNDSVVDMGDGNGRVLQSRCSDYCPRGHYVVRDRAVQCCWECKVCSPSHVSNVSMAASCVQCNEDHVSNSNRSRCVYVALKYLTWTRPWSIVICVCTLVGFVVSVFIMLVFVRHRHSPVVRASCFEISVVLLFSISLGFLLPLMKLVKPSETICKVSALSFAVIFTMILSLTLAKINRTVLILKNRLSSGFFHRRFLLSSPAHFTSVALLTAIQASICIAWFFSDPPNAATIIKPPPYPARYLHCTNHEHFWFLISSGFLIVLSFLCTLLAFRSRNFPENYNHAKFVSLAMFTFNMVWLTFMCAYYGNSEPGFQQPIFHSWAIIFSNFLLLLFIYGPKVYVIFFRPELNNARTFREMTLQHILGASEPSRNFSLASLTAPGHGNVYMMDCDSNNKAVQTLRVFTHDAQTQTEFKESKHVHKTSLVRRLLRIGSSRRNNWKTGTAVCKRGYSESDAHKTSFGDTEMSGPCHSSPYPLYSYCELDNPHAEDPLDPFDNEFPDDFGLRRIEEDMGVTNGTANSEIETDGGESSLINEYYVSISPDIASYSEGT